MRSAIRTSFISIGQLPMSLPTAGHGPSRRGRTSKIISHAAPQSDGDPVWRKITVPDRFLRLSQTLHMGQAFRWHATPTSQPAPHAISTLEGAHSITREWAGCIQDTLYVLRQAEPEPPEDEPDPVYYLAFPKGDESTKEQQNTVLVDYLRADADYRDLFTKFRAKDVVFDRTFPYFRGVRTIRHDPVECLFSYMCSANNHMKRTGTMVNYLADTYGRYVHSHNGRKFYSFPTVQELAENGTTSDLRNAGFGYRANYIVSTAKALLQVAEEEKKTAEEMLLGWRKLGRKEVEKKLIQFPGIGRKVAGCISLISLDQLGAIPVDTHVWQMGTRYLPELKNKKLNKASYDKIGECFRGKFGEETAGLAHNILFAAELGEFEDVIPGGVPEKLWTKNGNKRKRNADEKQKKKASKKKDDSFQAGRRQRKKD